MKRGIFAAALLGSMLVTACDGPREQAGERADAAANKGGGVLHDGPAERLGAIQDRTARDQAKAIEARADAAEDQADAIKAVADERADALEQEAKKLRRDAKQQAERLDTQADALRK